MLLKLFISKMFFIFEMINSYTKIRIFPKALLVMGVLVADPVMSAVVWTQSPLLVSPVTNLDITNFAISNDFELVESASLTGFTVFLADRAQSTVLDGNLDNFGGILGWAIYSNLGSAPGTLLLSGSDASPDILSSGSLAGTREMFQVDASFGSAIDLEPGIYWISIRDGGWGSATDNTIVGWVQSTRISLSSGAFEDSLQAPTDWVNLGVDFALTIHADVVPEPSVMMILVSALSLIVTRRNRHQSLAS